MSSPAQLTLRAATQRWTDTPVLDSVDLTLRPGERVGVVGDNGSGKSTLLGVLAGVVPLNSGERRAHLPGGLAYAPQTLAVAPHLTVSQLLGSAPADLRAMERRLRDLESRLSPNLFDEYAELTAQFDARAGYDVDVRLSTGLDRLGLGALDRDRAIGTLSGGEQARLALAIALSAQAQVLLLDEPTNDLDDAAISWLEQRLLAHRGTVVAVTHDRVFLQRLTDSIVEVEGGRVRRYGNGWTGYLTAKQTEREQQRLAHEQWVVDLNRQQELLADNAFRLDAIPRKLDKPGFGHGAFRARGRGHGAMSRIRAAKERIDRLTEAPVAPPAEPLRLDADLQTTGPAEAEFVVEADDLAVAGRLHLESLRLAPGGRLLVTGPNGAGKTTLLRVLSGELAPTSGRVAVRAQVGQLRQGLTPWPARTRLLTAYAAGRGVPALELAGELLAHGLFRPADLRTPVAELSVGQQRRLELARLLAQPHDLLLLDEPTNHLTPALMDDLEQAVADYPGAVVLVTHDRLLRSRFPGDALVLAGC